MIYAETELNHSYFTYTRAHDISAILIYKIAEYTCSDQYKVNNSHIINK